MSEPFCDILDLGLVQVDPLALGLSSPFYVRSLRVTHELDDKGIADECELVMWFDRLNDLDTFINSYVRCMINLTIKYGWKGKNTAEIEKFQIRGIKTSGNPEDGFTLTLKGYSPILEANDKVCEGPFYFAEGVPMKASECIEYIAAKLGWQIIDELGTSSVTLSNDKPEVPYIVEQVGDFFESYAQFIQRLANMLGYHYYMRYSKDSGIPIIYFVPCNTPQEVYYDHEYYYNTIGIDPFKMILTYDTDITVTKTTKEWTMASNTLTPLETFNLDQIETSQRGADSKTMPTPVKGGLNVVSGAERSVETIQPVLQDLYMKEIDDIAEITIVTLGNPLGRQAQSVWINNADTLTNGIWNVNKVVHDMSFDNPSFQTSWTMGKNSIPLSDQESFDNKEDKLQNFDLDEEEEKE